MCLDNSFWDSGKTFLHTYKLEKDIDLILTIRNDKLIETKQYKQGKGNFMFCDEKEVLTDTYLLEILNNKRENKKYF